MYSTPQPPPNFHYVPNDAEVAQIRDGIAKRLDSLSDLSAQIENLKAKIECDRALISPARKLPQDLLEEIFLACVFGPPRVMSPLEAPLLLCRICSAWRTVALAFPRLWTSLHINIGHVLKNEQRVAALADWLLRSSPFLLSITLWAPEHLPSSFYRTPATAALCQVLVSFAGRWRTLDLMNIHSVMSTQLRQTSAPSLEVCVSDEWDAHPAEWKFVMGGSLRRFSICSDRPGRALLLPLEWAMLTHLCVDSPVDLNVTDGGLAVGDALQILKRCAANLVSFKLRLGSVDEVSQMEPIFLKALESFAIVSPCFAPTGVVERLIRSLVMPRLLSIDIASTWPAHDNIIFLRSLSTYSPLLTILDINLESFTRDTLRQTLQLIPTITVLRVTDMRRDFDLAGLARADGLQLLRHLTPHLGADNDSILSPTLRRLKISKCVAIPDAVLVAFVQRRMGHQHSSVRDCTLEFRDARPVHVPNLNPLVYHGSTLFLSWYEVERQYAAPSSGLGEWFLDDREMW
ncbi:hypothetical protein B0H14DRAFT_2884456 [Mycena olivaceomarginata]|nr:hypothetical protein B0H14DRAFT_2884456 [Mycena olivaceomarginata]